MADFIMVVDSAIEVQVNLLPLLDDTDFKTRETGVAYNAAGMDLVWNFVTTAGTVTQTAVTPTTSGTYDWTHVGDGIYKIEIPASGGASINNDTEGFGWFSGFVTGVLPWRGPVVQFSPANVVNSLVNGSDKLEVDLLQIGGDAQSATDLKDFADSGYDPATNKIEGVKLADTITTYTGNTVQTGDSYARIGAPVGASISDDVAGVKAKTDLIPSDPADASDIVGLFNALTAHGDATWATATGFSTHSASDVWAVGTRVLTAGTNIALAKGTGITGFNDISSGDVSTAVWNAATASYGSAGSYGALIETNLDAAISTRLATSGYTAPLDAAGTRTAVGLASANLDTQLGDLPTATENADALLKRDMSAVTGEADRSPLNALRRIRNKNALVSSTLTIYKEDDTTSAWSATVATDTDADPIVSVDPA